MPQFPGSFQFFSRILSLLTFLSISPAVVASGDIGAYGQAFFIPNEGQLVNTSGKQASEVLYYTRLDEATVYFRESGVSYVFSEARGDTMFSREKPPSPLVSGGIGSKGFRLDMDFEGALAGVEVEGVDASPTTFHYYQGHCPEGITDVEAYGGLVYRDVYEGIDVLFYFEDGRLKYDFHASSGADLGQIRLKYGPLEGVDLEAGEEELLVATLLDTLREALPSSYHLSESGKSEVSCHYRVNNKANEVSFEPGEEYDPNRPLVIDPLVRGWATYLGGKNGDDRSAGITTDSAGNVYLVGNMRSTYFPVTSGAFQDTFGGGGDAFVTKFDSTGQLIWSTYYGGSDGDDNYTHQGNNIAYSAGKLVFGGGTRSSDFPVSGDAYQDTLGGSEDAFLVLMDTSGKREWATYYGGSKREESISVAMRGGRMAMTGSTYSLDFPVTGDAFQDSFQWGTLNFSGPSDAYLVVFDTAGNRLSGSYYGGRYNEWGYTVSINASGEIAMAGWSRSPDLPVESAIQDTLSGPAEDGFIAAFDTAYQLSYATYLGGVADDEISDLVLRGDVLYFTGRTSSGYSSLPTQFPVTGNAYQSQHGGGSNDAIVGRMTLRDSVGWLTFLGGGDGERGSTIAVDDSGGIYISGTSQSPDFPTTKTAFRKNKVGLGSGFLTKFNASGVLQYSTYCWGTNVACDPFGRVYVSGFTSNTNFPTTSGSYQPNKADPTDVWDDDATLAKFIPCSDLSVSANVLSATPYCPGNVVTVETADRHSGYSWYKAGSNNILDTTRKTHLSKSGTYIVRAVDTSSNCVGYDTVTIDIGAMSNLRAPVLSRVAPAGDSVVRLEWARQGSDSFFSSYTVYRKASGDTGYQVLDTLTPVEDTTYFDSSAYGYDTTSYRYMLTQETPCAFPPDTSNRLSTVTLGRYYAGCASEVGLQWNDSVGGDSSGHYALLRADTAIYTTATDTLYRDSTLPADNMACYRLVYYEGDSSRLSVSDSICSNPYAPAVPVLESVSKVQTDTNNGSVKVKWSLEGIARYLSHYRLYRRDASGGFALVSDSIGLGRDSLIDTGLDTKHGIQSYYMQGVDSCGRISDSGGIHRTMDLEFMRGQLLHDLRWSGYEGWDSGVKRYVVERKQSHGWHAVDTVSGGDTSFQRHPAPCNHAQTYRIRAERDSVHYSYSDTAGKEALDTLKPDVANLQNVSIVNDRVARIDFGGADSLDIYGYEIQRRRDTGMWVSAGWIGFDTAGGKFRYYDTTGSDSGPLCYRVMTLDSCLNAVESDTFCPVLLKGTAGNERNDLEWHPFTGYGNNPEYGLQRETDSGWQTLSTITDTSYTDSQNLACNVGVNYRVRMVSGSGSDTSYSNTVTLTPFDTTAPPEAGLHYASVNLEDEVKVEWEWDQTSNQKYFEVWRDDGNGNFSIQDTVVYDSIYIDQSSINPNTPYGYYVRAIDSCSADSLRDVPGNRSKPSDTDRIMVPEVATGGCQPEARLSWTPYETLPQGTDYYKIHRQQPATNNFQQVGKTADTTFTDTTILDGNEYCYRIEAVDTQSGYTAYSDSICMQPFVYPLPGKADIIKGTITRTGATNGITELEFEPATQDKRKGYIIYRSADKSRFAPVDTLLTRNTNAITYSDSLLNTHYSIHGYYVKSFDSCGNVVVPSDTHQLINLQAESGHEQNELTWTAYEGWDVATYEIHKDGELLTTVGANRLNYIDDRAVCTTHHHYRIRAVKADAEDVVSWSNRDSAQANDNTPPEAVNLSTATVEAPNKEIRIEWERSNSYDANVYKIYRQGLGGIGYEEIATIEDADATSHIETLTEPTNRQICYYVRVQDHCGNISKRSNAGCVMSVDGEASEGVNKISWDKYAQWPGDVAFYEIYKQEDSSFYEQIGRTTETNYSDENLKDRVTDFCYQVEAHHSEGDETSRSFEICLRQPQIVHIPNSFTPGITEGQNDKFGPKGLYIKNYEMQIFNRWGEEIFSTESAESWDGTYEGKPAPAGIYLYSITVIGENASRKNYEGSVTIVR